MFVPRIFVCWPRLLWVGTYAPHHARKKTQTADNAVAKRYTTSTRLTPETDLKQGGGEGSESREQKKAPPLPNSQIPW